MVAYSDAQTLRIAAEVMQQLESEIVAAATSTTAAANVNTHTVVEEVCRDVHTQLEQTRADALCRDEEVQHRVEQISAQLQQLTEQLNKFRPASEKAVGVVQTQVSKQLQQRFNIQNERIDKLSISVNESQTSAQKQC